MATRIGIALAVYQPEVSSFAQQLESIQAQTHTDWFCVATLDSPLDDLKSVAALRPFFGDSRFIWIQNPVRMGHKKNFERAIQECVRRGAAAVACSDQDDVWYPRKLEVSLQALRRAGSGALVHSDMRIRAAGEVLPETAWVLEKRGVNHVRPSHLYVRNVVAGASMLMDAELARRFPTVPDGAEYHDHWYALVASYFGGVHSIPEPLFEYRQHQENVVGVTPYRSYFWVPSGTSLLEVFRKCRRGWERTRRLGQAAVDAGLPVSGAERVYFLRSWDLGWGLLVMALRHLRSDLPLSRTAFSRAVGKLLSPILRLRS